MGEISGYGLEGWRYKESRCDAGVDFGIRSRDATAGVWIFYPRWEGDYATNFEAVEKA